MARNLVNFTKIFYAGNGLHFGRSADGKVHIFQMSDGSEVKVGSDIKSELVKSWVEVDHDMWSKVVMSI